MKHTHKIVSTGFLLLLLGCKPSKPTDSIQQAEKKNEAKIAQGLFDKETAAFLVKVADARLMDIKEGALAVKQATTATLKNYGRLMVKDQQMLLGKISSLAKARNITLPKVIGSSKQDGYTDLLSKTGKDFDEKFIKSMRIDHERDVKDFTKASQLADAEVKAFALLYLPMIQAHLNKINAIKGN